jgi:predicted nucleic acid-binding protein
MKILVDSSIWIDYFKSGKHSAALDFLIDENIIVVNDLILTEIIPFLYIKKEVQLIKLLSSIEKATLSIDWDNIIKLQTKCLKHGINKIGIPDLIIVQNAVMHKLTIYSLDKHFKLISQHVPITLYA